MQRSSEYHRQVSRQLLSPTPDIPYRAIRAHSQQDLVSRLKEVWRSRYNLLPTTPVKVEYYDGSTWKTAGTHNVIQSTSDADVTFIITPATLSQFSRTGGKQTVSIQSNIAYSIELQGDTDTTWVTLNRQSGTATTQSLDITAAAQAVGAAERELSIKFKNNVTGSVIGTLEVTQAKGEDYSISWANSTLIFTNDDLNQIKNNTLTANADWYIEEDV